MIGLCHYSLEVPIQENSEDHDSRKFESIWRPQENSEDHDSRKFESVRRPKGLVREFYNSFFYIVTS